MRYIGTAELLMQKYAEGFALKIQLGEFPPEANPREEKRIIRKVIMDKFKPGPCVLKEETKVSGFSSLFIDTDGSFFMTSVIVRCSLH